MLYYIILYYIIILSIILYCIILCYFTFAFHLTYIFGDIVQFVFLVFPSFFIISCTYFDFPYLYFFRTYRGLIRMNSSDSGWDFTMRTNMSNTSLHGGASNSKSNYSLANNNNMNNNSSLSLQKFLNNDDVRRKISQSNMMIDYRSGGGEYRNYNNYSHSNGSPSDYYHKSLDTSMHGNNNYSNNNYSNSKMKSNNYQEKNSGVLGGGLDTSFHGLSLKNPNIMSSPQSSSVFGHSQSQSQRNKSSSTKSSSQENVRNFICYFLTVFFLIFWLFLFSLNFYYYFYFHSYCLLLLLFLYFLLFLYSSSF